MVLPPKCIKLLHPVKATSSCLSVFKKMNTGSAFYDASEWKYGTCKNMERLKLNELSMQAILSTEIQHTGKVYRAGPYVKETTYNNTLHKPNIKITTK